MMLSRALIKNAASSSGWKELITMKCYKEYENDRRKYAIEKNRNTARSRVVGYVRLTFENVFGRINRIVFIF